MREGLDFCLAMPGGSPGAEPFTTASLLIRIDGEPAWPIGGADVPLDIQVDDLLSYLTEFWKPLTLRQTYPIAVAPDRPSLLRSEAERRWDSQPTAIAEREDEWICAFEEAHDLSRCFAGLYDLQPFWLLRSGERMIVDWRSGYARVSFEAARTELTRVGDVIATHLARDGERWSSLIENWEKRDRGDPIRLLAWTTSLGREAAARFAEDGLLEVPGSVPEAANDDDELWIAARMASALPADQIREVLTLIRTFERQEAPELEALGTSVSAYIEERFARHRAHEQGEAAAVFVRDALGLPLGKPIDITRVLEGLAVIVHPRRVEPNTLDALAVWGRRFGPAILCNLNSARAAGSGSIHGKRAVCVTLAHELCHLLLDKGHAVSAIDILNSRMPQDVERRAKSFAGEFLLPSSAAFEAWSAARGPRATRELGALLGSLASRFRVPRSVAAWKLDHGLQRQDIDLTALLDIVAPFRWGRSS